MNYFLHLLILFEIYVVVAATLNLVLGYGGLLQIAHAAYFGIGAYTAAVAMTHHGFGFPAAAALAGLVAAALSVLVSLPAARFRGDPFVLLSLAVQVALFTVFNNAVPLTGGPFGIPGIPRPAIAGLEFSGPGGLAALFGVCAAGCVGLLAFLQRSPFGRSLRAVRDDALAARSVGIGDARLKAQTFAVASAFVGFAGAMYAAHASFVDPTSFNLDASILMLSMVIVGGTGNLRGPLVGAAVLVLLPELLRFVALPDAVAGSVRLLIYGLLLVVLMRFRPQGLAGIYRFE